MIRLIAAIDSQRGLADEHGIPWDLPGDKKYFRDMTVHGEVLMGYRTYTEFDNPLPERTNYVLVRDGTKLRQGFLPVYDILDFVGRHPDAWIIGGAKVFNECLRLDVADELYLTELEGEFGCTKFFPSFRDKFEFKEKGNPITENGITYLFNVYRRKA